MKAGYTIKYSPFLPLLFLFIFSFAMGQIKEETANTRRVYEPDVKKIEKKEASPTLPTLNTSDKKNLQYPLTDIEPVSDFETSNLPPSEIDQLPKEKLYKNYVEAGYGNLGHLFIDGFAMAKVAKNQDVGLRLYHNSYNGIKDFPYNVSTSYGKTRGEIFYQSLMEKGKLHADFNFQNQRFNLYGSSIPEYYFKDSIDTDVKNSLNQYGGKIAYQAYNSPFFRTASFQANYLTDRFDTQETRIKLLSFFDLSGYEASVFSNSFDLGAEAKVFAGVNHTTFSSIIQEKWNYFHTGITPLVKLHNQAMQIKAGASIEYLNETAHNQSKFYFFPSAEINYHFNDEVQIIAGVEGGMKLNTYQQLTDENLYVYPNQLLLPTENKYGIYTGLNGFIGTNFSFSAQAKYTKARNLLFFQKVGDSLVEPTQEKYTKFNTFSATYDQGSVINFIGEIKYLQIENLNLALQIQYNGYTLDSLEYAFNRPNLTAQIKGSYKMLHNKLSLGTDIYFVGSRKTNEFTLSPDPILPLHSEATVETLASFVDLNLQASYALKPNISIFLKTFNLLNSEYQTYSSYTSYGRQFLGGIFFKF